MGDAVARLRAEGQEGRFRRHERQEHDLPILAALAGEAHRCLVPLNAFSEFNKGEGGDIWFALAEDRPLACFAGIYTDGWASTRKLKDGETTDDLYAFLTTEPNAEVGAIYPKAMPVILTTEEESETWLSAPWSEAKALQRSLLDGALAIVARDRKHDV